MTALPQTNIFGAEALAVLELAPTAILIRDGAGALVLINREARELLGRPVSVDLDCPHVAAAVQLYVLGTNTLYPADRIPMAVALSGREWRADDLELRRPDKTVQLEVRASPVFGEDGQVAFAVTTFVDVTERRNAETERWLVEAFADALGDAPTFGDAIVIALNRVREITGWTFGQAWLPDAAGVRLHCRYASSADLPGLVEYHAKCRTLVLRAGVGLPGRVWSTGEAEWLSDAARGHRSGGLEVVVGFPKGFDDRIAIPVSSSGAVVAVLEFFVLSRNEHDQRLLDRLATVIEQVGRWISKRQSRELHTQQLHDALELERAAAERLRTLHTVADTVLQSLAHDLRNPIAAVLTLSQVLHGDAAGARPLAPEVRSQMLSNVELSARKMERLLQDLVDSDPLRRLDSDNQSCDVGDIVARTLSESDVATLHPVHTNIESVRIDIDAAHVERIVDNLLANAVKYVAPGVAVWVSAVQCGTGVLISVEDAGAGVPIDAAESIFEPFRRGAGSTAAGAGTTSAAHGLGLGLSLVARFAQLHGGRAWVEPRAGGGASFRVLLADDTAPADTAPAEPALTRAPSAITGSAITGSAITGSNNERFADDDSD